MIKKENDYYRISYKESDFDFKILEIKESTHMSIVGSDEKVYELHIKLLKPIQVQDEVYYPELFNAIKYEIRSGELSQYFNKRILEVVFKMNRGVDIRFSISNVRAEYCERMAETATYMSGSKIFEELNRLFLRLSSGSMSWVCSEFDDNV